MWHSYGVIMVHYVVESVPEDQTLWGFFVTTCMLYLEGSGFDIQPAVCPV
jgi:hypothetical protein